VQARFFDYITALAGKRCVRATRATLCGAGGTQTACHAAIQTLCVICYWQTHCLHLYVQTLQLVMQPQAPASVGLLPPGMPAVRVNVHTGITYAADPAILGWDIIDG
jgi:hypothetical protein